MDGFPAESIPTAFLMRASHTVLRKHIPSACKFAHGQYALQAHHTAHAQTYIQCHTRTCMYNIAVYYTIMLVKMQALWGET